MHLLHYKGLLLLLQEFPVFVELLALVQLLLLLLLRVLPPLRLLLLHGLA